MSGKKPIIDKPPQPWKPADATDTIRKIARGNFDLLQGIHDDERLSERGLIASDLVYVLKNGFVYDEPKPSSREGLYKYEIECPTPNSNGRSLRVVVIPCCANNSIRIITIMWRDETMISGSRR